MNIERFFEEKRPAFSLEIFPPKKTNGIESLYKTLDGLKSIHPDFISVTYGAGNGEASNQTMEIAKYIQDELHVGALAHLTCVGGDADTMAERVDSLKSCGISNILALRGDLIDGKEVVDFEHASDLVRFIKDRDSSINVVGACYPEGHAESKSLDEDIDNLRYKLDAGVSHLITQLFFDNEKFYRFVDKVRSKGIDVPIEAGIMPIVTTRQIERTIALSGASLPSDFTHIVSRYSNNAEALFHAGTAYAIEQIYELVEHGVDGIHLYTMNNARVAQEVYDGVKTVLNR